MGLDEDALHKDLNMISVVHWITKNCLKGPRQRALR